MPPVYEVCDMFDPNPMYTSDQIVVKHIPVIETLLKLDLEPKGQGHSKQVKQVMNDLLVGTEKGKRRSRLIRLIITTTGRFLESRTKFNF